jgi:hypothetical protein
VLQLPKTPPREVREDLTRFEEFVAPRGNLLSL